MKHSQVDSKAFGGKPEGLDVVEEPAGRQDVWIREAGDDYVQWLTKPWEDKLGEDWACTIRSIWQRFFF